MLLKFETEKEWLEARKRDVTSTEVAALFGLHPFKSRLRLWQEKAERILSDFEESNFSRWGKRLQTPVALGICEDAGWEGFDLTGYYFTEPAQRIGSSMDVRAICPDRGTGFLEVKVAESFTEEAGWTADRAPLQYELQLQTQLHLAHLNKQGIEWGAIGTLGRRQKTRLYFRQYDRAFGQRLDDAAGEFWRSIETDTPPAADYAVDGPLLESLRGPLRDGPVNLTGNARAAALADRLAAIEADRKALRDRLKPLDAEKDRIKFEMYDMIGRNEGAIIGPYEIGARIQAAPEERIHYGSAIRRFDFKKRRK